MEEKKIINLKLWALDLWLLPGLVILWFDFVIKLTLSDKLSMA